MAEEERQSVTILVPDGYADAAEFLKDCQFERATFPTLTREQVDALLLAQNARVEVAARILEPTNAERDARETGGNRHICEVLIKQLDDVRKALELRPFARMTK